tara:strand:+ start:784 stop:1266 length:483 start_codon:yes stop_codon:yes gene_type:complete
MNIKKFSICLFLTLFIFIIDRVSKLYILNIADITGNVDIYISSYLNFYLIWNKGIAFGFFSFEENLIYHLITTLIIIITLIIIFIIIKTNDYRAYFLAFILGGSYGNLFDRIYYSSVPDFIDFHINDFHWFIFNVADIFITIGVFCLIFVEIFYKKNVNE